MIPECRGFATNAEPPLSLRPMLRLIRVPLSSIQARQTSEVYPNIQLSTVAGLEALQLAPCVLTKRELRQIGT